MKPAVKGILAYLACVLATAGSQSAAQVAAPGRAPADALRARLAQRQVSYQPLAEVLPPGTAQPTLANGAAQGVQPSVEYVNGQMAESVAPPPFVPPSTDSCNAYYGKGSDCPPVWYVDQGVRILNRGRPHLLHLGSEFQSVGGQSFLINVIDTRSTAFQGAAGYMLTVGRFLGNDGESRDNYFEFSYWGLNHWNESYTVNGGRLFLGEFSFGDLFSPIARTANIYDSPVAGFSRADRMSIVYDSEVHNFEWNLRIKPRPRHDRLVLHPDGRWERETQTGHTSSYFIGVRYLTLDESFAFRAQGRIDRNGTTIANTTGEYLIYTHNDMAGIQVGAEFLYHKARWNIGVRTKVGPYINWAEQSSHITTTNAGADPIPGQTLTDLNVHTKAFNDKLSLIGEVGFTAAYRLRPNFVVKADYDLIWLSGIAMAPEQVRYEVDPPDRISAVSTLLLQGLSLHAEVNW